MPRAGIFPARGSLLDEYAAFARRCQGNCAGIGAIRMETARGELAGRCTEHADQSAGRTISFRSQAGDSHAAPWWLRFRIRCGGGAKTREYFGRRTADFAADGQL